MKFSIICFLFLLVIRTDDNPNHELQWSNIETLGFGLPKNEYRADIIYFYHALLSKSDSLDESVGNSNFSFTRHAQPLDLFSYWNKRGQENYDVLLTKTAYILNESVDFFSEQRLSDPVYISKTMPSARVSQKDSVYHVAVGFGAPNIDYTLKFYTNDKFLSRYPLLNDYFLIHDDLNESPELISVQHNFNYGRVMFQKTSKMSVSVSRYFGINEKQTLVLNYTLNYIHNMPPSLLGGSDFLVEKIKEGIKALIEETQNLCIRKF